MVYRYIYPNRENIFREIRSVSNSRLYGILYVVVPLALHNTLDLRRAERVRTLDALRCAFVVIAYYAAVAFRMTSMCGRLRKIQ